MLARKRAAMRDHEIGGAVEKTAERLATGLSREAEIDAAMHQPIAEMAVERGMIAELVQQRSEVAEIGGKVSWREGAVLPALIGDVEAGHIGRGWQAGFPDFPELGLQRLVGVDKAEHVALA